MKKCNFCGIDISNKRKGAKFCSNECCNEHRKSKRIICVCEQCNKIFEIVPAKFKLGLGRFCSKPCVAKYRTTKVKCICENCGETFEIQPYRYNHGGGKFCSPQCRGKIQSGSNHPQYIGGSVDEFGYRTIIIGGHRIKEHRWVLEQYLGRELTKDECVHHINGIRDDNNINNLQLMTNSEHCSYHNKLRSI